MGQNTEAVRSATESATQGLFFTLLVSSQALLMKCRGILIFNHLFRSFTLLSRMREINMCVVSNRLALGEACEAY